MKRACATGGYGRWGPISSISTASGGLPRRRRLARAADALAAFIAQLRHRAEVAAHQALPHTARRAPRARSRAFLAIEHGRLDARASAMRAISSAVDARPAPRRIHATPRASSRAEAGARRGGGELEARPLTSRPDASIAAGPPARFPVGGALLDIDRGRAPGDERCGGATRGARSANGAAQVARAAPGRWRLDAPRAALAALHEPLAANRRALRTSSGDRGGVLARRRSGQARTYERLRALPGGSKGEAAESGGRCRRGRVPPRRGADVFAAPSSMWAGPEPDASRS